MKSAAYILCLAGLAACASPIRQGAPAEIHFQPARTEDGKTFADLSKADMAGLIVVIEGKYGREQYHFSSGGDVWISRADVNGLQGRWSMGPDNSYCVKQRDWYPDGRCWHLIIDKDGMVIGMERTMASIGVIKASLYRD